MSMPGPTTGGRRYHQRPRSGSCASQRTSASAPPPLSPTPSFRTPLMNQFLAQTSPGGTPPLPLMFASAGGSSSSSSSTYSSSSSSNRNNNWSSGDVYYKFGPTGTQQQQKKKSTPAAPPPMPSAFNYVPRGRRARRGSKILPMKEDARTSSTRKNLEDKVFEEHMAKLMRESSISTASTLSSSFSSTSSSSDHTFSSSVTEKAKGGGVVQSFF